MLHWYFARTISVLCCSHAVAPDTAYFSLILEETNESKTRTFSASGGAFSEAPSPAGAGRGAAQAPRRGGFAAEPPPRTSYPENRLLLWLTTSPNLLQDPVFAFSSSRHRTLAFTHDGLMYPSHTGCNKITRRLDLLVVLPFRWFCLQRFLAATILSCRVYVLMPIADNDVAAITKVRDAVAERLCTPRDFSTASSESRNFDALQASRRSLKLAVQKR